VGEPLAVATYELPRGTFVGKYEILRRLATGGMAEIYLARSTGTHGFEKLVVLKRILPNVAEDPGFVSMFLDEARIAATLHHPNIGDVYDVGTDRGIYFYTMEFVFGQDVGGIRRETKKLRQPSPLEIALAIVHGAASALEFAHEKTGPDGKPLGLVHRDVSGSNIMVSYDGAVKLLDFGIARASTSSHKTRTGAIKGKIPYMSPEQCRSSSVDRRTDLWALGVVLYQLTVGKKPFAGDTDFAIMDQIVNRRCRPPSAVVRDYPPALDAIVMKLLERDLALRYQTCEELLHDLDAFIQQNNLWMPQRQLGKYMRNIFAAQIQAWEQAQAQGVSLDQHVASVITSRSGGSLVMLTPTSAASALPISRANIPSEPLDDADTPMLASYDPVADDTTVAASSNPSLSGIPSLSGVSLVSSVSNVSQVSHVSDVSHAGSMSGVSSIPAAPPRSRRLLVIGGVATLLVAAGISVFVMSGHGAPPVATTSAPAPAPAPAPATATATATAPAPAPAATPPAPAPPPPPPAAAAKKPEPEPEPAPADPAPTDDPAPQAAETAEPPTPPSPPSSSPSATPHQRPRPKKPAPAHTTPSHAPSTEQPAPKEQPWDPNSPFLPGG
jgi:serine/threonine protein kinase